MTVVDLVGRGRGDVAGLAALGSRLRRAADLIAESATPQQLDGVHRAADAVDAAGDRLRNGQPVLEVEATLARDLSLILGSERTL